MTSLVESYMQNIKQKVIKDAHLRQYSDLINKIAKVEYRSMGTQHLVEFDELINIGFQTINILCEQNDFSGYNESYLSTAIKWAIRNELRNITEHLLDFPTNNCQKPQKT